MKSINNFIMEIKEKKSESVGEHSEPPKKRMRSNYLNTIKKEEKTKRNHKRARIIIRNISYKANEESLKNHFGNFGNIEEINLLKRPDGKLVGCAFLQYEAVNEAAKAILNANNKDFLGRTIYVDWAMGKDLYEKKASSKINNTNSENDIKKEENEDASDTEKNESIKLEENSKSEEEDELDSDSAHSSDEDSTKSDDTDKKEKIKSEERKKKYISNDVAEGCTIFIKNVPFDATNDDLSKVCKKFGPMYYALINTHQDSGHSKGTGFVKFKTKESADLCLSAGDTFVLMDAVLEPYYALSRDDIRKRADDSKRKEPTDNRNLYLAKEGLIMTGSSAADGVSASDMAKRHKLEQVKTQILKNLNRFISKNRLSIHNVPVHYNNEKLRNMVEKHTGLKVHECRVMRENKPTAEFPEGRPKGFGFMSFKTHQEALTALRKLNNNPTIFNPNNRPIVAFSIEDRSVHNVKQKRLQKSLENNPTYKKKAEKHVNKKKEKKTSQGDVKKNIAKEIKNIKQKNNAHGQDEDLADFAGMPSKPGTYVRMRSNKKLKAQAVEHTKNVSALKKIEKRKREKQMLNQEKKEIDRPKQGKRKGERDNFSFLVNKYKRMIESGSEIGTKKSKRTKWYVE